MNRRRVFVGLLLLAALAVVPVRRWFVVDACIDAGGIFDYTHVRCSNDASEADS